MLLHAKGIGSLVTERNGKAADSENGKHGTGYIRQGQERAEHAVVDSEGVGREMAVVVDVMQTSRALRDDQSPLTTVSMERSKQQHRDEHSKEYPCTQLPLMIPVSHK